MITFVTMLWGDWGGDWQAEYVNRLYRGIARHFPAEQMTGFRLITDTETYARIGPDLAPGVTVFVEPLPQWDRNLRKVWLYRSDNGLWGRCVFFDLDTVIVDDIEFLATYRGHWCGIQPFDPVNAARDTHSGGGIISWEAGTLQHVWNEIAADPDRWAETTKRKPGDKFPGGMERFVNKRLIAERDHWQVLFPGHVVSYKRHVVPKDARNVRDTGEVPKDARIVCFHGNPRPHVVHEQPWMMEHWR